MNTRKKGPRTSSTRRAALALERAKAKAFLNPHSKDLLVIAQEFGKEIRKQISGARVIVGGSLRSNTAVGNHNDIDLRILMPARQSSNEQLAVASQKLSAILPFKHKLEKPPYLPLGFHHQKDITRPYVGRVAVEATVQPAKGYFGLAAKSAKLPSELRYRYIALKGQSMASDDRDSYKAVKKRWAALIHWLNDRGYFRSGSGSSIRSRLLKQASTEFPEFFATTAAAAKHER